jgi:hypothetical protein
MIALLQQAASMTDPYDGLLENVFVLPGTIEVSAEALKYARAFIETVAAAHGDHYLATFEWSQSVSIRAAPDAPHEPVDDCLMLAAAERKDVPPEFIQTAEGVEFAIFIPVEILQASVQRVIDLDRSFFFKLALR